jgi:hypothetical protein
MNIFKDKLPLMIESNLKLLSYLMTILFKYDPAGVVVKERLGVVEGEGEHAKGEHVSRRRQFNCIRIKTIFGRQKIKI